MTNLARKLTDAARRYAERPAIRLDEALLSYTELNDASARVAARLRSDGLAPGDRVGIMLPNVPAFPVVYYGVLRAGGVVVPMNPLLKAREIAYYLGDAQARAVFAAPVLADEVAKGAAEAGANAVLVEPGELAGLVAGYDPDPAVAERADDDTAMILYTSGTTGRPKGAELTHANLAGNTDTIADTLLALRPDDVVFGGLPLFHVFGQTCALNAAVAAGACLTLLPRFDPATALQIVQRHRVTVFEGVPTMYSALLQVPDRDRYDVSCLRLAVSGGSGLPGEVLRGFEEAFGVPLLEGYGLSETSPVVSFNRPDRPRKAGTIGTAIQGVEMKVVDGAGTEVPVGEVGEIIVRGPNVMKGYWRRPEATAEAIRDGWLRTGDLARQDADGYFAIVDRTKDVIIRGGLNIYPREVEEVLYEHPAVADAAVVGIPHLELGEEVAAAVTLKPSASATPEEIREHVRRALAAYKYPRHVWFVDELPKGPTGKILKREVTPPDETLAPDVRRARDQPAGANDIKKPCARR